MSAPPPGAYEASLRQRQVEAIEALKRGDWPRVQSLAAWLLERVPSEPGGYYLAGIAASRLDQSLPAVEYLRRAAALAPAWPEPLAELARAHLAMGHASVAAGFADRAFALEPAESATLDMLGVIYGQAGLHDRALAAFRAATARAPRSAVSHFNLGATLAFTGQPEAAAAAFEACLERNPRFWRAYLFLAQVQRHAGRQHALDRLEAALVDADSAEARFYLHMASAKVLEELGRYEDAFLHLVAGKAAGSQGRGYAAARDAAIADMLVRACPEPLPPPSGKVDAPIFIVGMPRSGTTLVERILSSHPRVRSAGELRNFMVALQRAAGEPPGFIFNPAFGERTAAIDWAAVRREYLATTSHLRGDAPHFIDKLPHNFLYAGFIARAFPDARILCLRRDPMDTCLSNFRQVFALDSPYYDYSFDLLDTGRQYLMFDRLAAHWRRVLPGRFLEVDYEALVDAQEAQTRRMLAFCGLEWDPACLRFEDNAAPVATASVMQVRSPMNRSSIGRWRRYEAQLQPLRELLEAGGVLGRGHEHDAVDGAGRHA